MEKVKIGTNQYQIVTNGVTSTNDTLTIKLLPSGSTVDNLDALLSDQSNVEKIQLLSEEDEVLKIYSGYTKLSSVILEKEAFIKNEILTINTDESNENSFEEEKAVYGALITVQLVKMSGIENRLETIEATLSEVKTGIAKLTNASEISRSE